MVGSTHEEVQEGENIQSAVNSLEKSAVDLLKEREETR
jgi:hypothetical protein